MTQKKSTSKDKKITEFSSFTEFKKARPLSPERQQRVDAAVRADLLEMSLGDARVLAALTQGDVAASLETTQGQISRIEAREDHLVSTLRKYIEALGGELEITARFGDKTLRLRGV